MTKFKKHILLFAFSISVSSLFAQKEVLPHLEKKGSVTQLMVHGKPFLILGGELHNSSTSSAVYMHPIWEKMKQKNLNTVIAPVYWELLEPQEGKFDFTLVDSMIYGARKQGLHLGVLWFGSWKNGYSMYVPGWVKRDTERFPRTKNKKGESFVVLSALSENSMKADANAFKKLMQHIRLIDEKFQTVIMVQIENEAGLFYEPREYSIAASSAYDKGVPKDLIMFLSSNKGKLQPEIDSAWNANGNKTSGSWEELFGKSVLIKDNPNSFSYLPEELFTVYYYSKYIGAVAAAGKEAYPIPMYVNAWIKQKGFSAPSNYPSGGPIPHTLDLWRMNAPAIDFISPDIYVSIPEARFTIEQYNRPGNPVFIPEFKPGNASASLALWAYGSQNINCFSPFGIDDLTAEEDPITKTYAALSSVQDLILSHQGKGSMLGIYVDTDIKSQSFELNGYAIKATLTTPFFGPVDGAVAGINSSDKKATTAGGIVFANGSDEFIVVGKDFSLSFTPKNLAPNKSKVDIEYMDDGNFVNGKWVTNRRLNGDEGTGGGDYGFGFNKGYSASFKFLPDVQNNYHIVRYKLYQY